MVDLVARAEAVDPGQAVAGVGAVLAIVGAYLPWFGTILGGGEIRGIGGDGIFTMLFGALVVGILIFEEWRRRAALVVAGFGGLTLLIAGVALVEVRRAAGNEPRIGLWLTLAGGVGMVLTAVLHRGDE